MSTRVAFVQDPHNGAITALFPDLSADMQGNKTCYAHVGQHGAYSNGWADGQDNARPEEYAKLLYELRLIGYDDLIVLDYWGDTFPSCIRLYYFGEYRHGRK